MDELAPARQRPPVRPAHEVGMQVTPWHIMNATCVQTFASNHDVNSVKLIYPAGLTCYAVMHSFKLTGETFS